ncbi:aminotransferase class III-fold pyridoxal phosphate-dependent enzyme [Verminephrobacter eiseniae]|uniref:aminotransferase n=1 Tax=Verminephrobacter eiseniae TaxID=364317 RepID=UPI00223783BC|nr:aminotransferase [Verminephrobacter eiseniae]MCW5259799.1 aminotransferase class III-fold pyridoxal phosphate-dependent enzyme [Verminephrobacter eiseniae]
MTKTESTAWHQDIAHVVHPYSNLDAHSTLGPTVIARGDGCYVYDEHGKRYIEGMSGLWCASLGFSEKRLVDAATKQLNTLPYYHLFSHRSHPPGIALAQALTAVAPEGLNHVLFSSSGSEANDAAVKLIWYYNNLLGRPQKKKIISRLHGYHGVTVASGSLTGLAHVHRDFDLPLPRVLHTDCPSHYHFGLPGESEPAFTQRITDNLEQLILKEGPETVAAFIAEPVSGAGGVIVPPAGYFERVQAILKKYDILFIVDEVITGFGRTGRMFGCETYGLQPDMMTVAKGLSGAYQPISGLLLTDAIHDTLRAGSRKHGAFAHGLTYAAHPVAAAVALETLHIYRDRDIVGHVREVAPYFLEKLDALADHPLVGQVRGVGLIAAVEITADKAARKPFEPTAGMGAWIQNRTMEYGVIVRTIAHCVALCPPLISERQHIDELFGGLSRALDDALVHVRANK